MSAAPSDPARSLGEPSLRRDDLDSAYGFEAWSVVCTTCGREWIGRAWSTCPRCVEVLEADHGRFDEYQAIVDDIPPPPEDPNGRTDMLRITPASTVRIDRPRWVWDRRIPVGGTTLMPGVEGLGKTALTCWLLARLTRGQLAGEWQGRPSTVVYVGLEDDRATVLNPRLIAAGADLDRVLFVDSTIGAFNVMTDSGELADRLTAYDDVSLIVLDPLDAHLLGTDTHRKSDTQQAIGRLAGLAQVLRCGSLGLAHMNKGEGSELLRRVVGSVAFTTSVRSVIGVGENPEEPTRERLAVLAKSNMTDKTTVAAIKFRVDGTELEHPDGGEPISTGVVTMLGEVEGLDPNSIMSRPTPEERSAVDAAVDWLNDVLADGPVPSADVKKWARAAEIQDRTLQRARSKARVLVTRNENQQGRPSVWELQGFVPKVSCQTPVARNNEAVDLGLCDQSGGFVPAPHGGTKPAPTADEELFG